MKPVNTTVPGHLPQGREFDITLFSTVRTHFTFVARDLPLFFLLRQHPLGIGGTVYLRTNPCGLRAR